MKKIRRVIVGEPAVRLAVAFAVFSILLCGLALALSVCGTRSAWLSVISLVLGCLSGLGQVFVERPREAFARGCLGVPLVALLFVAGMELYANVNQQRTRDLISQQTKTLADKMVKLMAWDVESRNISIDDEKNFVTLVWLLSSCSTNADLRANVWIDGSFHFYWYKGGTLTSSEAFTRNDAALGLAYLASDDLDAFRNWWTQKSPSLMQGSDPWTFDVRYSEGTYITTLAKDLLDSFQSLGVAMGYVPDSETKTVRFYLCQEALRANFYDGEDSHGKYVAMTEREVVGFGDCDMAEFCNNVFRWLNDRGLLVNFKEPRTCVIRTWVSMGCMMTLDLDIVGNEVKKRIEAND